MNRAFLTGFLALAVVVLGVSLAGAQGYYYGDNKNVGGVMINASGMVSQATLGEAKKLAAARTKAMQPVAEGLRGQTDMRRVSLKKVDEVLAACRESGKSVPEDIFLLGGLTAVEYVFVYPEANDIVLVGPAEEWTVGPNGVFVGKTTGKTIMLLDDLAVAMRATQGRQRGVFSVSIDPTPEGLTKLREYTSTIKAVTKNTAAKMEEALGPQVVTLAGVPADSHFAGVMAAADFRMKQISMGAVKSPVSALPSFVSMVKNPSDSASQPRWWLAPNYEAVTRDAAGLAWNLQGGKVVTMTETDLHEGGRIVRGAGKASPVYSQWADKMTENYEQLAAVEPIFGQLRNCMDAAIVAAIIAENGLLGKIDNPLDSLTSPNGYEPVQLNTPKNVPSTAVMAKKGNQYMTVTGGVSIDMWKIAKDAKVSKTLSGEGKEVAGKDWWK